MRIDSSVQAQPLALAASGPSARQGQTVARPATSSSMGTAAEKFEAMFVGQMLRSVRESSEEDTDSDPGENSAFLEMAEDQLAQTLAARGGLGIATMVKTELGKAK